MSSKCFILKSAALVLTCLLAGYGSAEEWEKVKDIPLAKKNMTRGEASYSEATAKFYNRVPIRFKANQALTLRVTSTDYQPAVIVRDSSGKIIARGLTKSRELKDGDGNPILDADGKPELEMWCELDFVPPDEGVYLIDNTTANIGEGAYEVEGALWQAPEPEPEPEPAQDTGMQDQGGEKWRDVEALDRLPMTIAGFKASRTPTMGPSGDAHRVSADYQGKGTFVEMYGRWVETGDQASGIGDSWVPEREKIARREGNVFYYKTNGAHFIEVLVISPDKEAGIRFLLHEDRAADMAAFVRVAVGFVKGLERTAVKRSQSLHVFGQ